MVRKYKVKILQHQHLVDNVYSLEFESLGRIFKYKPGQFLHVAIDDYDGIGQWPDSRCFSIQTSPICQNIVITYAANGVFTNKMAEKLKVEDFIWIKLPFGNLFEMEHNLNKSVFIAGGTGITPFLSLFNDDSFKKYNNPYLFLGLREKRYNLYHRELDLAQKINSSFKKQIYYENESGRPNIEKVLEVCDFDTTFFISGPPAMITYYRDTLLQIGFTDSKILTDDWE